MADFPIEKLVRDALTLTHGNGTSALMTMKIGTEQAETRARERAGEQIDNSVGEGRTPMSGVPA